MKRNTESQRLKNKWGKTIGMNLVVQEEKKSEYFSRLT